MALGRRGKGGFVRPSPRWGDEGVASTVGTIMALMVFMALLSVFTNQYVPVWMEDNEAKHMSTVESQFGMMRHGIDTQILVGQLGGVTDIQVYTPITLGSEGVPMFASPTAGFFRVLPDAGQSVLNFSYDVGGTTQWVNGMSQGTLEMEAPNRYYVPQTLVYENDAIILKQEDGMIVKSVPQFLVRHEGAQFKLVYTQITLHGVNKSYAGTTTTGVLTSLMYTTTGAYSQPTSVCNLTVTSRYIDAWQEFFVSYLGTSGMGPLDYVVNPWGNSVSVLINAGVLSSVTLNEAHIDVAMGEVKG
jgi:hypothetical protein